MNDSSQNVVVLMQQVRQLFEETAKLLQDADKLMIEHEWSPLDVQAVQLRYKVRTPGVWFPQDAFRLYTHEDDAHQRLLSFVSAIFHDREDDQLVKQGLLSAGWLTHKAGIKPASLWLYDYPHAHVWKSGRRDDGVLTTEPPDDYLKQKYPVESVTTLAVPLFDIQSQDDLRTKVMEPMLDGLQKVTG